MTKMEALEAYKQDRELCKNPDRTPYQTTHAELSAFLCGWDAAMKSLKAEPSEKKYPD